MFERNWPFLPTNQQNFCNAHEARKHFGKYLCKFSKIKGNRGFAKRNTQALLPPCWFLGMIFDVNKIIKSAIPYALLHQMIWNLYWINELNFLSLLVSICNDELNSGIEIFFFVGGWLIFSERFVIITSVYAGRINYYLCYINFCAGQS